MSSSTYLSTLCSCVICHEVKSSMGIHTHYLRAHGSEEDKAKMSRCTIVAAKNNLGKESPVKKVRETSYSLNPNRCLCCNKDLPYRCRNQKFCNRSCAATYNNTHAAPGRKFGPKKTRMAPPKRIRVKRLSPVSKKTKRITRVKPEIVGVFSKVFYRTCKQCNLEFVSRSIKKFCSNCGDSYARARNKFQFTFNVFHYPDLFDLSLIKVYGWYSPGNRSLKNINGISRDHRVSVNEAVLNNYDPYYITHPLNCELMLHNDNKTKYIHSSLSYEALVSIVDEYESKRHH